MNRRAFSVVEIALVVAIGGVLSTMALPAFKKYQLDAKRAEVDTNVSGICKSLEIYHQLHDTAVGTADLNPRAVGALDGQLTEWLPGEPGWEDLQYEPDGKVRATYFVHDDSENTPGDWYVRGSSDIDEDGFAYHSYCYGPAWTAGTATPTFAATAIPLSGAGAGAQTQLLAQKGVELAKSLDGEFSPDDMLITQNWLNYYESAYSLYDDFMDGTYADQFDEEWRRRQALGEAAQTQANPSMAEHHAYWFQLSSQAYASYFETYTQTLQKAQERVAQLKTKSDLALQDYFAGNISANDYYQASYPYHYAQHALDQQLTTDEDLEQNAQRSDRIAASQDTTAARYEALRDRYQARADDPNNRNQSRDQARADHYDSVAQRYVKHAADNRARAEFYRRGSANYRLNYLEAYYSLTKGLRDGFAPEVPLPGTGGGLTIGGAIGGTAPGAGDETGAGIMRTDREVKVAFSSVPKAKNFAPYTNRY